MNIFPKIDVNLCLYRIISQLKICISYYFNLTVEERDGLSSKL